MICKFCEAISMDSELSYFYGSAEKITIFLVSFSSHSLLAKLEDFLNKITLLNIRIDILNFSLKISIFEELLIIETMLSACEIYSISN